MVINDWIIRYVPIAGIAAITSERKARLVHLPPRDVVTVKVLGWNANQSMSSIAHGLRTLWTSAESVGCLVLAIRPHRERLTIVIKAVGNHVQLRMRQFTPVAGEGLCLSAGLRWCGIRCQRHDLVGAITIIRLTFFIAAGESEACDQT